LVCLLASALSSPACHAQTEPENEHRAVLEVGAAFAKDTAGNPWSRGGTLAVEVTPIENWLELELGLSALRGTDGTDLTVDLLFKKPYRLSSRSELMIGLGPEVVRGAHHITSTGVEGVLDFMFWPGKDIGWYVEPGYELVFQHGTHRAVNIAAGLLVGFGH
jgi:hypothetical protein